MFTQQEEPTVLLRDLYETYRTCSNITLTRPAEPSHLPIPTETSPIAHQTCRNNHTYLYLPKHPCSLTGPVETSHLPDLQTHSSSHRAAETSDLSDLQQRPQLLTRPTEPSHLPDLQNQPPIAHQTCRTIPAPTNA